MTEKWMKEHKNTGYMDDDNPTDYEVFIHFINANRKYIDKTCSYTNASYNDLQQDFAVVYFSNPKIAEYFKENRRKEAYNLFRNGLRQEVKKYFIIPTRVEYRKEYENYRDKVDLMYQKLTEDEFKATYVTKKRKRAD